MLPTDLPTTLDRLAALGCLADPDEANQGRLRPAGDLRALLREGAHRILDIAVWAATAGLRPVPELTRHAQRDAGNLLGLDRSVWQERFGAVLMAPRAAAGLRWLHEARALQLLVPEVVSMVDFHKSCPVHHKDIFDHTLQVVEKCPPSLVVRWVALMHDAGKVWTRTVRQGKVHFFRHEELSASLMEGVAGRFHMEPELRDRIAWVIANHARANVYTAQWTDSAVRRLIRDMGPYLDDVLAFSQSDYTTRRSQRIAEVRSLASQLNERIPEIAAGDAKRPALPKGFGSLVLQETGLPPGPWLGTIQRWLEDEADAGRLERQREAPFYLAHVRAARPDLLDVNPQDARRRRPTP